MVDYPRILTAEQSKAITKLPFRLNMKESGMSTPLIVLMLGVGMLAYTVMVGSRESFSYRGSYNLVLGWMAFFGFLYWAFLQSKVKAELTITEDAVSVIATTRKGPLQWSEPLKNYRLIKRVQQLPNAPVTYQVDLFCHDYNSHNPDHNIVLFWSTKKAETEEMVHKFCKSFAKYKPKDWLTL